MPNRGYSDPDSRWDQSGPTGLQRRSAVKDPTGVKMADGNFYMKSETRAGQFKRGGWDKYEVPTGNDGDETGLPEVFARGGNADTHLSADYPGGTVA